MATAFLSSRSNSLMINGSLCDPEKDRRTVKPARGYLPLNRVSK